MSDMEIISPDTSDEDLALMVRDPGHVRLREERSHPYDALAEQTPAADLAGVAALFSGAPSPSARTDAPKPRVISFGRPYFRGRK